MVRYGLVRRSWDGVTGYACAMSATRLLIDLDSGQGWLARGVAGSTWRRGDALPADVQVIGVVPAENVALHRLRVPTRRAADLRQAVPFALEEKLAEPVEQLHFALGQRDGEEIDVAVVARRDMQDWLQREGPVPLSDAVALVADAQLLPRAADAIHLAQIGERLLVALPDAAHVIPVAQWQQWRALLPPMPLRILGSDGAFHVGDSPTPVALPTFLRFAGASVESAPNLRQGAFAATVQRGAQVRQWRWAAVLAAVALLLVLADAATGYLIERSQRAQLQAQIAQVFEQALPGQRMTADPAAQLASEAGRGGSGSVAANPLARLAEVAPLITQGSRYRVYAIDYRGDAIELEVLAADVGQLDALRETIAARGMAVAVTGVDPHDEGVRGRLRLGGAGS